MFMLLSKSARASSKAQPAAFCLAQLVFVVAAPPDVGFVAAFGARCSGVCVKRRSKRKTLGYNRDQRSRLQRFIASILQPFNASSIFVTDGTAA
jgi:hypothetical protein